MNSPARGGRINAEVGESLMMRRTLLKVPTSQEPHQRKTLFRTTCKSGGKVCKVIIDSRSTDNLVSVKMVEKFHLKRLPHPFPYNFSWLTKEKLLAIWMNLLCVALMFCH